MSWDEAKLEALVSDNVASVNAGDEEIFASRRNVRRKGQAMSDAAAARLKAQGIDPESFEPISLGIGVPAVDTVPKEELALSMQRAVLQGDDSIGRGHSVWGYGWANPIREALAAHFSRVRGVEVTTGHFLADGGSSGAIGSISRAFLSPGDAVISERPGYVGSMDAFTAQPGVRYVGVDLNDDGLDMAELASVVSELKAQGNKAKMIYIQSLYHNPRGTGYTVERMRELLTYCAEHSILILNDEAYYGLHLDPESEPVFLSTIAEEMGLSLGVITACTFSKTIAPGLRAGFSFADPLIISQISSVKMGSVSTVLLLALADFIERGEWSASTPLCKQNQFPAQISSNKVCAGARRDKQIAKVQGVYTEKLNAITASIDEHCSRWLTYERPRGGLYVWVTLRDGVGFEANDVQLEAIARGLNVQDGTQYYLPPYVDGTKGAERPGDLSHLRLCADAASGLSLCCR